ncbi:ABC transporter permease [Actinomyces qiguomingii]|uniref:ABC transporter permease n=1 Tax=Actinomyces qiguomingii TaxID=2057800 RepID=UPI000CA05252|nr:ABC transporter permease [Actinomyces qiguomingii]
MSTGTDTTVILQSQIKLAREWTRFELAIWLREPTAVILNIAYPLIMLMFFFVSPMNIQSDSNLALSLIGYLSLVGVLMVCTNFPATGVPEARESEFYLFSRTLPTGPGPRLAGWLIAPIVCALISATGTFLIGVLVTAAHPTLNQAVVILGVALLLTLPITTLGLALGFLLSKKTALAVSLTVAFVMILFGGISGMPMPTWVDAVAKFLPTGAAGAITSDYLSNRPFIPSNLAIILVWTVVATIGSVALYRRDEGKNFR